METIFFFLRQALKTEELELVMLIKAAFTGAQPVMMIGMLPQGKNAILLIVLDSIVEVANYWIMFAMLVMLFALFRINKGPRHRY